MILVQNRGPRAQAQARALVQEREAVARVVPANTQHKHKTHNATRAFRAVEPREGLP